MSGNRSKLESAKIKHNSLLIVTLLALGLSYHSNFKLSNKLDNLNIHINEDIRDGEYGRVSVKDVPEYTVYNYAKSVTEWLYYWKNNGEKDFKNNIEANRKYISPQFYQTLKYEYGQLTGSKKPTGTFDPAVNQLSRISKLVISLCGSEYDQYKVKRNGDEWLVRFHVRHIDSALGKELRRPAVQYTAIVKRLPLSDKKNEYGLQHMGWAEQPVILSEEQAEEICKRRVI